MDRTDKIVWACVIILLAFFISAALGVFNKAHASNKVKPDNEYYTGGWTGGSTIQEFTPKGNPNYTCVLALANGGIACFPKENKKDG